MSQTYPELDELNEAFLRMLRADPQPLSSAALLWHELLQVYPETSAVRVRSRGDACLLYVNGHASLEVVPGRNFGDGKRPHEVCVEVLKQQADSENCPHLIAFHYEQSGEGVWTGGYSIETEKQHGMQSEGHELVDGKLLTLKFGALNQATNSRLTSAAPADVDRWLERVLTADTLEAALER